MAKKPMVTVRVTPEQHRAFKMACLILGTTMADLLRGAVDATIAVAEAERQWWETHDKAEAAQQGPVVVSFNVGGGEEG